MYEDKKQSDGAIYTNDYKTNDKQPDWTGKKGNEYKYARLDIPMKKEEPKFEPVQNVDDNPPTFNDEDIPF